MDNSTTTIDSRSSRLIGSWLVITLMICSVAFSQVQTAIDLGSTANYAILAGSVISNVSASAVTGDVGLSPAAGSGITGFGTSEISGSVYTVDATGPAGATIAPTLLAAVKGDLVIAYNSAAGRTPVPSGSFLNPGSGNIGGLSLKPGLYKFTNTASITGSNVTLTGTATDVWIFQIAAAFTVGSGIQVHLAGGALAANVFWQVGTTATLGSSSIVQGTIMAAQSITFGTGATLIGRAFAANAAVTLSSSTVTRPVAVSSAWNDTTAEKFALFQNYPNPFNPATQIQYSLEKASTVTLTVYNIVGDEVAILVKGHQEAGKYTVPFNTNDGSLKNLPTGIYFYRLKTEAFVSTKKLTLMK